MSINKTTTKGKIIKYLEKNNEITSNYTVQRHPL